MTDYDTNYYQNLCDEKDMELINLRARVAELESAVELHKEAAKNISKDCGIELAALKSGQGKPVATANVGNGTFYVTAKPEQLSKLGFNLDEIQEISLYTQAPTTPAGWQLVPKEMTSEMEIAGNEAFEQIMRSAWPHRGDALLATYTAMLSAAPQPGEWDEKRMDIIGQNGNNGEHYAEN